MIVSRTPAAAAGRSSEAAAAGALDSTRPAPENAVTRGFPMRQIRLEPPLVQGQCATFRWKVTPETPLYRKSEFTLRFPPAVDLARVPERLWWDIFLIVLHSHWLLLRPCEIRLPIKLGPGEARFWQEHLRNGLDTLALHVNGNGPPPPPASLGIEIVGGDVEIPRPRIEGSGFGTAFSGGKDSLLQAALLAELTERPLLVATTSPMPQTADHETTRRRQVFAAIQARRKVNFVEVESDLRANWDQGFATVHGYGVGMNEIADAFLYTGALLAAGAAIGATHLFLASEAEVQENALIGGKIVQHPHFMYSAATQRALAALLAPYGLRYGSLTWPLYSAHVQHLLWTRYPDLCDLQYSCWLVGRDEAACSRCGQCLRLAVIALEGGFDPQRMGIDLETLAAFSQGWNARWTEAAGPNATPRELVSRRFERIFCQSMRRISLWHVARVAARGRLFGLFARRTRGIVAAFRALRRRVCDIPPAAPIGVREAFCDWLDPDLRDRLVAIFRQHLPAEPRAAHAAVLERSAALTARAAAALA